MGGVGPTPCEQPTQAMIIAAVRLCVGYQFIPTCVGAQTVTAILQMTVTALRKRWFLHATKCTHLTIISIII